MKEGKETSKMTVFQLRKNLKGLIYESRKWAQWYTSEQRDFRIIIAADCVRDVSRSNPKTLCR